MVNVILGMLIIIFIAAGIVIPVLPQQDFERIDKFLWPVLLIGVFIVCVFLENNIL